ncbi:MULTISPECIES: glycosyltransferase family 9 protein [Providencia]|uniref:Glycosyltransferase family 9 protein n=1 Tax=Providencia huaxiensis TaxID=2027290 RepID=A0ABU2IZL2_9GAMM|nr:MULTISPECIES: glycosyltransferase family 9 protein [Providencia]MBZ3681956.1 glycosyltransferase family 9 protein [Providencia rettgeri]AXH62082.1 glycosyltransferase family 9 protein [Providencia huaxiensis]MDT0134272.1 glycosyltransferase family 9 protein [Providencia huaxiensis]MDT1980677.1 glycosyltransferase family 9 protein [Providencia huaxiensis]QLR00095.1 glycosyltransferase family 9 protein [Providencia rettgeri]
MNILRKINRYRNEKTKKIKFKLNLWFMKLFYKKQNIDVNDCNNVCIFMHAKAIGDAIITSGLIEKIRSSGKKVYVIAPEGLSFLFSDIIGNDGFYSFDKKKIPELVSELKKVNIDLVIDIFDFDHSIRHRLKTLFLLKPAKSIGFDQPKASIYDINLHSDGGSHLTDRMRKVLDYLKLDTKNYQYKLSFDSVKFSSAHDYANSIKENKKLIILNPYASQSERSFSMQQINEIIEYLNSLNNYKTVVFNLGHNINCESLENVVLNPYSDAGNSFALVENADVVVSVDTAIVHLASAFNIKQYCVYNNKRNVLNQNCNIIFGANSPNAIQLTTSDNLGLAIGDPMSKFDVNRLINAMRKDLN